MGSEMCIRDSVYNVDEKNQAIFNVINVSLFIFFAGAMEEIKV